MTMSRVVLNKLLENSYENYQILFNHYKFHNHNAHLLGSLYFLGATDERLEQVYKVMCDIVDPYEPSPEAITRANWRTFLGDKRFCKAYKDFFEQEILNSGDNWHEKFLEFLLENNEEPLINGVICRFAHPLIHIGYAFELNNRIVAIEALTQTAVDYDELHQIIDKLKPPKYGSKSALQVFQAIQEDNRLSIFKQPEDHNMVLIAKKSADIIQFHYDRWNIDFNNMEKMIEELFDLSVYMYGATHKPEKIEFDFFILHILTSMHAIRVIYPHLHDRQVAERIILECFYFAITVYNASNRPEINTKLIDDYKVEDDKNNWNYVLDKTLSPKLAVIRHLPKVMHSLKAAQTDYGIKNGFYLKTAVKTIDNLNGDDAWVGSSDDPKYLISLKH